MSTVVPVRRVRGSAYVREIESIVRDGGPQPEPSLAASAALTGSTGLDRCSGQPTGCGSAIVNEPVTGLLWQTGWSLPGSVGHGRDVSWPVHTSSAAC